MPFTATRQNPAMFSGKHGQSKGAALKVEMDQDCEGFWTRVKEDIAQRI